jgi:hypothetical protein
MHEPIHKRPVTPWTVGKTYREADEGQIQHDCRTAIRDLIRLEGFEAAREHVAFYLIDELNRSAAK